MSHYDEFYEEESSFNAAENQPLPKVTTGTRIIDLVAKDLVDRASVGKVKYGKYLQAGNGRDALLDAYQEVLDLAMYLRQKIEEDRNVTNHST